MANVTLASNYKGAVGKWVPYYYKPFQLGMVDTGVGSTDGEIYITQTAGGTDGVVSMGVCTSSYNCGFYYTIEVTSTALDSFIVHKYTLDDTLIDTIYASPTVYDWDLHLQYSLITIDVGVAVNFTHLSSGEDGDIYKISLPTFDQMERRKIYHGGYAAFLRMPYYEDISFNGEGKRIVFHQDFPTYKMKRETCPDCGKS